MTGFSLSSFAREGTLRCAGLPIPIRSGEFWTSRQRQASSIHEISYRACFKPQLPAFFIDRFTKPGDLVYDPFCGRGTTIIEAGLRGRRAIANDANPLSEILCRPRLFVPSLGDVEERLRRIPFTQVVRSEIDLSMFYHRRTESEIALLRTYLSRRKNDGVEDDVDRWIRMVATNRLTGHSPGFFSVYTFPPNQAVQPDRQIHINRRRRQKPDYRDVKQLILRKTRRLLQRIDDDQIRALRVCGDTVKFLHQSAHRTGTIRSGSVNLVVTSPPFLDVVQYADDNWLRAWFNDIDMRRVTRKLTMTKSVEEWSQSMANIFAELHRILSPGGWVAFEVGEVKGGRIRLDEVVAPLGLRAGLDCKAILIHRQSFTKTSNLWGVSNNRKGTNTNRIVLFQRAI